MEHGVRSARTLKSTVSIVSLALILPLSTHPARADLVFTETGMPGTDAADVLLNATLASVSAVHSDATGNSLFVQATGIDARAGDDTVTNLAGLSVLGEANLTPLDPAHNVAIAEALARAITGGFGHDVIEGLAALNASAKATLTAGTRALTIIPLSLNDWSTTASAAAYGIDEAWLSGNITQSRPVVVNATATTSVAKFSAAPAAVPFDFTGSSARNDAEAKAVGIVQGADFAPAVCGAADCPTIGAYGKLDVAAKANATTSGLSVELYGSTGMDDQVTATADTTGIAGNSGAENIEQGGGASLVAESTASLFSADVKKSGLLTGVIGSVLGFLGEDARATAQSTASGIAGGGGDDRLMILPGTVPFDVLARATEDATWVTVTYTSKSAESPAGKSAAVAAPAALMASEVGSTTDASSDLPPMLDTSSDAVAEVTGVSGDDGSDTLTNGGTLTPRAEASAKHRAVTVDVSVDQTSNDKVSWIPGAAIADASTSSAAKATGLAGGEGNDELDNTGVTHAQATATAEAYTETLEFSYAAGKGLKVGAAFSDTSSTAQAGATGLDGGSGDDVILNTGTAKATASSTSTSRSDSLSIVATGEGLSGSGAITDSSTNSIANARGIADPGADHVTNAGQAIATATSLAKSTSLSIGISGAKTGVVLGVTYADASTLSSATGIGIDLLAGDATPAHDSFSNYGSVDANATGTADGLSLAVTIGGALEGVAAGGAVAVGEGEATADTVGVRTGTGDDFVLNQGNNAVVGGSIASDATANAGSTSVGIAVTGAVEGLALGGSVATADTAATARATGIGSGAGRDTVMNLSSLHSGATANATSTSVAVTFAASVKGVSAGFALAKTRTDGFAEALGIDTGAGDDFIKSTGAIDVAATANARSKQIALNFAEFGAAITDASTNAEAAAVGIRGGSGADTMANRGKAAVSSYATVNQSGTSVNLLGYASGDAGLDSKANATGLDVADAGQTDAAVNRADNYSETMVSANAEVNGKNEVFNGGGAAFADVAGTARSAALGIAGGLGADMLWNEGSLLAGANSKIDISAASFLLSGVQSGVAGANAAATATGIDGRDGTNELINWGALTSVANVEATAISATVGFGGGFSLGGVGADAQAIGIRGGLDADAIDNRGTIGVTSYSRGNVGAAAINLFALTFTNSLAEATLTGIDAGGGDDVVTNYGTLNVGIPDSGKWLVYADSESLNLSILSVSAALLGASAEVVAIAGGDGVDELTNVGTVTVGSSGWMAVGRSIAGGGQFIGLADVYAASDAKMRSVGLDGGRGADTLANLAGAVLNVNATSTTDVDSISTTGILGFAAVTSNSTGTAQAEATALRGDDGLDGGADTLRNAGTAKAYALSYSDSSATTDTTFAASGTRIEAEAMASATSRARGVDGGGGANVLDNTGSLASTAVARSKPFSTANAEGLNHTTATTDATGLADAIAITAGNGPNVVHNATGGRLEAYAEAVTASSLTDYARAVSDTGATAKVGSWSYDSASGLGTLIPGSALTARVTGIALGSGADDTTNDGAIAAKSQATGMTLASVDSFGFNSSAAALSGVQAVSIGIAAGAGANTTTNRGTIDVIANSDAHPYAYAYSSLERGTAHAIATALSEAYGITGDGTITNTSDALVAVTADSSAGADADRSGDKSDTATASATMVARATGIATATTTARAGRDEIRNDGVVDVYATNSLDYESGKQIPSALAVASAWTRNTGATATATGETCATGIEAGDNAVRIANLGTIHVKGAAFSSAQAIADTGWFTTSTGNATSNAEAHSVGIDVGNGANFLENDGTLDVSANATHEVSAAGDNHSTGGSISAEASAIVMGDGANYVMNRGTMTVAATAMWGSAFGVVAGSGGNHVVNRGTMTVAATAIGGSAFGVVTGSGEDTVEQYGTLGTSQPYGLIFSRPGTAIATGDGNDRVVLGTHSSTKGNILLGSGDDTFVVATQAGIGQATDLPAVDGTIDPGTGSDTFALGGDGVGTFDLFKVSATGTYKGFEKFSKEGPGSWTVSGTLTLPASITAGELALQNAMLGSLTIGADGKLAGNGTVGNLVNAGTLAPGFSPGVVTVYGDYVQTADGRLEIEIAGLDAFDRLFVTGSATLAGRLDVKLTDGFMPTLGDSFGFLSANGVFGDFASVLCPACAGTGLRFTFVNETGFSGLRVGAVPVPGAVWLFGSGLVVVSAARVRRSRAAADSG